MTPLPRLLLSYRHVIVPLIFHRFPRSPNRQRRHSVNTTTHARGTPPDWRWKNRCVVCRAGIPALFHLMVHTFNRISSLPLFAPSLPLAPHFNLLSLVSYVTAVLISLVLVSSVTAVLISLVRVSSLTAVSISLVPCSSDDLILLALTAWKY